SVHTRVGSAVGLFATNVEDSGAGIELGQLPAIVLPLFLIGCPFEQSTSLQPGRQKVPVFRKIQDYAGLANRRNHPFGTLHCLAISLFIEGFLLCLLRIVVFLVKERTSERFFYDAVLSSTSCFY